MEYFVKSGSPDKQRAGCVVVAIFERRRLSDAAAALDRASGGHLSSIMRRGDMDGKDGQLLLLHDVPGLRCDRVLLVGCGRERAFDERVYRRLTAQIAAELERSGARDAISYLTLPEVRGRDFAWRVRTAVASVEDRLYRFEAFKSAAEQPARPLSRLTFAAPGRRDLLAGEQALRMGRAIARGSAISRDLGNLPGNVCTPGYLAQRIAELAGEHRSMTVRALDEKDMEALGMNALLAVSRGSREPAKLIVIEYRGAGDERPYALVGKAVTFDSGGISLKPAAAMDEMKFDMCGGAGVVGTIMAAAELELPINIVGIVAATENMPDGAAVKPGDIVRSMSGKTVEILNTDAEGRLALCDALTYVERYDPRVTIDAATLTGACLIALGKHASALYANDARLARALTSAGERSGDRVWEMPLWDDYQEQLQSNFADVANVGGREAGSITAACFLSRFTGKMRWAHLDIAGTAWKSGGDKGATGRPVPLLVDYLLSESQR